MAKRRKRPLRAPPVESRRPRQALPVRLRGTQKGTAMAFVRHALGTAGPRHLSVTSSSTDLKSAGRKTVGVQVPLPPSLKTPARQPCAPQPPSPGGQQQLTIPAHKPMWVSMLRQILRDPLRCGEPDRSESGGGCWSVLRGLNCCRTPSGVSVKQLALVTPERPCGKSGGAQVRQAPSPALSRCCDGAPACRGAS